MTATEEFFVSLVQEQPVLWDKRDKNYKNIALKNRIWTEIANTCQIKAEEAQVLFNSIRTKYIRRKRDQETMARSGSAAKALKSWALQDQLKFLDDTITNRKTSSNILATRASIDVETPSTSSSCQEETVLEEESLSCAVEAEELEVFVIPVSEESLLSPSSERSYIPPATTPRSQLKPIQKRKRQEDALEKIAAAISAPVVIEQNTPVDAWKISNEVENVCKFVGNRLNEFPKKKIARS